MVKEREREREREREKPVLSARFDNDDSQKNNTALAFLDDRITLEERKMRYQTLERPEYKEDGFVSWFLCVMELVFNTFVGYLMSRPSLSKDSSGPIQPIAKGLVGSYLSKGS